MKCFPLNPKINLIASLRQWLESIEIQHSKVARLLCKVIPARCPFEREIKLFGRTISTLR